MSARGRILFVAGTGTDVGKTHVTCALIRAARARRWRVAALKPVATGPTDDTERHARALDARAGQTHPPLYALARPVSPHLASREASVVISIDRIVRAAEGAASMSDLVIVEGAGGLFSPLAKDVDGATLARALGSLFILVAPDRLGVLHDLSASLTAARARGLTAPGVVLSTPSQADESTGTNAAEARALGIADVLGTFPRASDDDPSSLRVASLVLEWIDQSPAASGGGKP